MADNLEHCIAKYSVGDTTLKINYTHDDFGYCIKSLTIGNDIIILKDLYEMIKLWHKPKNDRVIMQRDCIEQHILDTLPIAEWYMYTDGKWEIYNDI